MSSRRDFIKSGALGTVGLASTLTMSPSSYANIVGSNDRLNIAFIGLGRRVPAYYPILNPNYNIKLVYLCDVKKSQITNTTEKLKSVIDYSPKETDNVRKVLEDKRVDAIFNATPDHWHAPGTIMALDAGKHVYVEKPCAHNPREAEIMVAKQKSTGKLVQMGNQQRSSDHTREIIKDIHDGVIGRAYKAVAFYTNQRAEVPKQLKQEPPTDLNWDLFQGPAPRQEYYHNIWDYNWHWYGWKWGTAETGNNAIHELDIGRWALNVNYPEHVVTEANKQHYPDDGWEMYDTMYATFRYADQKSIVWDGKSRNSYATYGSGRGTIIYGTEGSVYVDRSEYKLYDRSGALIRQSAKTSESGTALGGGGNTSTAHIRNFLETIRGEAKLNAPIEDGAISNHLALLANISYRIDAPFEIDTTTGKAYNKRAMELWSRDYEPGWEVE